MVHHRYVEFLTWLEFKDWRNLGRESLAKKLGVGESTVQRALRNEELHPRTLYKLWKATGKVLDCFQVEGNDFQFWMFDHDKTEREIADETGIPKGTIKRYIYDGGKPSAENAAILFRLTGLEMFSPVEDPVSATARLLHDQVHEESEDTNSSEKVETLSLPKLVERQLPSIKTNDPKSGVLKQLLEELLSLVSVAEAQDPFEALVEELRKLRDSDQNDRNDFIEKIGRKRLGYWASMLSALSSKAEFDIWQQMSDHSLGEVRN